MNGPRWAEVCVAEAASRIPYDPYGGGSRRSWCRSWEGHWEPTWLDQQVGSVKKGS